VIAARIVRDNDLLQRCAWLTPRLLELAIERWVVIVVPLSKKTISHPHLCNRVGEYDLWTEIIARSDFKDAEAPQFAIATGANDIEIAAGNLQCIGDIVVDHSDRTPLHVGRRHREQS